MPAKQDAKSKGAKAKGKGAIRAKAKAKAKPKDSEDWHKFFRDLPTGKSKEDKRAREELFMRFDRRHNGKLKYWELEEGLCKRLALSAGELRDRAAPVRAAFDAACDLAPKQDGHIPEEILFREFRMLLVYLQRYMDLWDHFTELDVSSDNRVTLEEFKLTLPRLRKWGLQNVDELERDPQQAFNQIDKDGSGWIDFHEFADWCGRHGLEYHAEDAAPQVSSASKAPPAVKASAKRRVKVKRRESESIEESMDDEASNDSGVFSEGKSQTQDNSSSDTPHGKEEEAARIKAEFVQTQADELKQNEQTRTQRRLASRRLRSVKRAEEAQESTFFSQMFGIDEPPTASPEPGPGASVDKVGAWEPVQAVPADELPIRLGGGSTTVLFWKPTSHAWGGDAVQARNDAQELQSPRGPDPSEPKDLPLSGWNPAPKKRLPRKRLVAAQAFMRVAGRQQRAAAEPSPRSLPEPAPQGLLSSIFGQQAEEIPPEAPGGGRPQAEEYPPEAPQQPPAKPTDQTPPQPPAKPSPRPMSETQLPLAPPTEPSLQPSSEPPSQTFMSMLFGEQSDGPMAEEPPHPPPMAEEPPHLPPKEPAREASMLEKGVQTHTTLRIRPKVRPQPPPLRPPRRQPEAQTFGEQEPEDGSRPQLWPTPRQPEAGAPEANAFEEWEPEDASEESAGETTAFGEWKPDDASEESTDEPPRSRIDKAASKDPPPALWNQSKGAVKDLRAIAAEVGSPQAAPETGFCFAPAVALRLTPGHQGEIHKWSPPQPEAARHGNKPLREERLQPQAAVSKVPPSYKQVLAIHEAAAPPKPAVVPLRMDYQTMCRSQLGPASLQPGASLPIQQFRHNMLSTCGGYTNMSRGVQLPAEKPEFRDLIEHFNVEFDGAGRPWGQMDRDALLKVFEDNKEIRKKLTRDGLSMRPAFPKPRADLTELVGHQATEDELKEERERLYGRGQEPERPPRPRKLDEEGDEGWYHKIKLDIVIVKAINVPENVGLYHCDPYVQVTVLDGNPFSDEAVVGGTEWYNPREQWHGETPVLENTTQPEWRTRMEAEIRPREDTVIHLKLLDQDLAALKDRGVGQCAIPISEVQKDCWHGVRPIALEPFDTKKAKEWASLVECRLFFSVGWEGSAARVKHKLKSFKQASGRLGSRADRLSARSGRTTPTSAVSLADPDENIVDADELLNAAPARPVETLRSSGKETAAAPVSDASFGIGVDASTEDPFLSADTHATLGDPFFGFGRDTMEEEDQEQEEHRAAETLTAPGTNEKSSEHKEESVDNQTWQRKKDKGSSRMEKSPSKGKKDKASKEKSPSRRETSPDSKKKSTTKSSEKKGKSTSSKKKDAK